MERQIERRVVITGLGVVAPNGLGKEAFWRATSKGISGIKPSAKRGTTPVWISSAHGWASYWRRKCCSGSTKDGRVGA